MSRFESQGKTAAQAERVLADSTEAEIDRKLLAQADLILDGTQAPRHNADRVIELAMSASDGMPWAREYAGGFDRTQRTELIAVVADRFAGYFLPKLATHSAHAPRT